MDYDEIKFWCSIKGSFYMFLVSVVVMLIAYLVVTVILPFRPYKTVVDTLSYLFISSSCGYLVLYLLYGRWVKRWLLNKALKG